VWYIRYSLVVERVLKLSPSNIKNRLVSLLTA
jgi:hypothetical protein